MIYKCINNDEARAPKVHQNHNVHPEYVDNTLTVGRDYIVYATSVFYDDVRLLVQNDNGDARWKAPYFFEEVDGRVPPYWEFHAFDQEGLFGLARRTFQAIWGYPELVQDLEHNDGLQDNRDADVQIFLGEVARRSTFEM